MLTVGHFIDYIGYARGGAEINVEGLCRHNTSSEFIFEVVTSVFPFSSPSFQHIQAPIRKAIGLYYLREFSFLFNGAIADFFYRFPGIVYGLNVRKHLAHYDLIHIHGLDVMSVVLSSNYKAPVILTLYNPLSNRHKAQVSRADCIIIRSKLLMADINKMGLFPHSRVVYIPPGCNLPYHKRTNNIHLATYNTLLNEKQIRLLFIGRLRPFKNLENLIKALHILNYQHPEKFTLTVVGEGPRKTQLKLLAKNLNVASQIHFIGNIVSSQMLSIYHSHDLIVVPSFYESFSQVSLEALVAGKRLLISEGLSEFRNLFPEIPTCDPNIPSDIAQKILNVASTPPINVSEDKLKLFDWQNVIKQHYEIYSILRDKPK